MATAATQQLYQLLGEPLPDQAGIQPTAPVQQRDAENVARIRLQRFTDAGDPVELDTESGAPFLTRLNVSRAPDAATKEAMLQQAFSGARIEKASLFEGGPATFVVRDLQDPTTGRTKDLLVDETGITAKDLADLGQVGIEILGALAAMRGGGRMTGNMAPGFGRSAADVAIGAVGGQAAGALSDVQARTATAPQQGQVSLGDLGAIGLRRGIGAGVEAGVGIGGVAAPIAIQQGAKGLFRGLPATEEAARTVAARGRLAASTGVDVPLSLGQQTGREGILRSEAFIENVSFGGGPQRRLRNRQEAAIEQLQNAQIAQAGTTTPAALPTKDVVGQRAVDALRSVAESRGQVATAERAAAMQEGLFDLQGALSASTGLAPSTSILTGTAGQAARDFMVLKKDVFDEVATELNQQVVAAAGTDAIIPSAILREHTKALRAKLTRPGEQDLYRFVPTNVRAFLDDIEGLPPQVRLEDIRNLRTAVNEAIDEQAILGNTATGNLKQISKGLTQALEDSVAFIGQKQNNPSAAAALSQFNKFYRENIGGFQVKGIEDILADPTQRKLGRFAIFDQAAKDPDQYFRLKDGLTKPLTRDNAAVGPINEGMLTWATFKQAMLQEMMKESRLAGSRSQLDARKLFDKLSGLKEEVQRDLLGPKGPEALAALGRLEATQSKLNGDEFLQVLSQEGNVTPRILAIAQRERELDDLYRNQVVRRFAKGELGAESIQPGDFVDRYLELAPAKELKDVMGLIATQDPDLLGDIRQKTIQNLFTKAKGSPLDDLPSARRLAKEIKTPEMQARLTEVLGAPGVDRLNDTLTLLTGLQTKTEAASRAMGGLVGGTQRQEALALNPKVIPKQLAYWFMGTMVANPGLWLKARSPIQPLDTTKAAQRILLESQFLRSLVSEYKEESQTALQMLQEGMGGGTTTPTNGNETPTQQLNRLLQ